jgi:hypothetical protein
LKPFDVNAVSSDGSVRRHTLSQPVVHQQLHSATLARLLCKQKCSSKFDVRFKDSKARANLIFTAFLVVHAINGLNSGSPSADILAGLWMRYFIVAT